MLDVASGLAPLWAAKRPHYIRCSSPDELRLQVLGPLRSPTRGKPARHKGSALIVWNQQFTRPIHALDHLTRQFQALVVEVAVVLASRHQLVEVQLDGKLSFLAPGFEQQRANRVDQGTAA